MDVALTFLLKTSLAKSVKDTTTLTSTAIEVGWSTRTMQCVQFKLCVCCLPFRCLRTWTV